MPISDSDPRVFFAAERTLLAWLRTGLTIMAIGFVISRFGLFLLLFAAESQAQSIKFHTSLSAALGIGFVVVGTLAIAVAALQHHRFVVTLPISDLPPRYSRIFALVLSLLVSVLGIALATYLFLV
jgi:putative membrane protein